MGTACYLDRLAFSVRAMSTRGVLTQHGGVRVELVLAADAAVVGDDTEYGPLDVVEQHHQLHAPKLQQQTVRHFHREVQFHTKMRKSAQ